MRVQDLADIFGVPAELLEETGTTNYSELRARMLEERQRFRQIGEAISRQIIEPFAQMILERLIASLILEIESDQRIKGFDTTGYL